MLSVNKPNNVIHYDCAVGFKINETLTFMVFGVYCICLFSSKFIVMFICRSKMDRAIYIPYVFGIVSLRVHVCCCCRCCNEQHVTEYF